MWIALATRGSQEMSRTRRKEDGEFGWKESYLSVAQES